MTVVAPLMYLPVVVAVLVCRPILALNGPIVQSSNSPAANTLLMVQAGWVESVIRTWLNAVLPVLVTTNLYET